MLTSLQRRVSSTCWVWKDNGKKSRRGRRRRQHRRRRSKTVVAASTSFWLFDRFVKTVCAESGRETSTHYFFRLKISHEEANLMFNNRLNLASILKTPTCDHPAVGLKMNIFLVSKRNPSKQKKAEQRGKSKNFNIFLKGSNGANQIWRKKSYVGTHEIKN